ncbi:peptide chain release factor aRF-1 [Thermofilum pendens]|uniref:Peptide chain release factor subunit 1 n=1 Tax=Thermofilum pendens (strain DSM 2475 / Hrk 5) TaxID=368408 RepID=A1RXJ5_THEPD|nr:peptide chain release factor aRF-1 [Thermofilum pendens]ABL77925.1 peptide chain release factor subunit 1 (aeRF-1) [Thermofilum pendens Hrk 5]
MQESIERYKLEKLVEELKKKEGRGTELVSLYIPAGRPISDVLNTLYYEYSTASNIKDRVTRHHVLDALATIINRLKLFRETPPNGLIVFAGYVAGDVPGREKMEVHLIEPPQKLNVWLYRCDSRFYTEILEEMIRVKEVYGLIVIERDEAAIAILRGKSLEVVDELTAGVPGKHRSGGQSARRFERIIEQLVHEFYKRVGEHANKIFLPLKDELRGIIIGGPGFSKKEFAEGDYLHYELRQKILGLFDVGYGGVSGLYELLEKSKDLIKDVQFMKEREAVNQFLYHLARDTGLAVYGEAEVREALQLNAVEKLLLSEDLEKIRVRAKCTSCKHEFEATLHSESEVAQLKCPKCGGEVEIIENRSVVEELAELAEKTGAEVVLVSTQSAEGKEFFKTFGGIGAILRYRLQR